MIGHLMTLKAYYDSSGKIEDKKTRFLTLAGYVATTDCWTHFESEWRAILVKHNAPRSKSGFPYFHMTEAVHFNKGYAGWSEERVRRLWLDLINLLGHVDRSAFIGFSCTVDLHGHKAVAGQLAQIRSPVQICIDFSFGQALSMLRNEQDVMELFFDRGELFARTIRKYRQTAWWSKYVCSISEVQDMRESYGTQAADTLAWTANRYYSCGNNDKWGMWFAALVLVKDQFHQLYDEQALLNCLDQNGRHKPRTKISNTKVKFPGAP
jgi:hypothetical protein